MFSNTLLTAVFSSKASRLLQLSSSNVKKSLKFKLKRAKFANPFNGTITITIHIDCSRKNKDLCIKQIKKIKTVQQIAEIVKQRKLLITLNLVQLLQTIK